MLGTGQRRRPESDTLRMGREHAHVPTRGALWGPHSLFSHELHRPRLSGRGLGVSILRKLALRDEQHRQLRRSSGRACAPVCILHAEAADRRRHTLTVHTARMHEPILRRDELWWVAWGVDEAPRLYRAGAAIASRGLAAVL